MNEGVGGGIRPADVAEALSAELFARIERERIDKLLANLRLAPVHEGSV